MGEIPDTEEFKCEDSMKHAGVLGALKCIHLCDVNIWLWVIGYSGRVGAAAFHYFISALRGGFWGYQFTGLEN